MKAIAPIKVEEKDNDEKTNAEIQLLNSKNFAEILKLWNQAFPILQNREHNFYYYTYVLKNLTVKPRKKYTTAGTFNNKKHELCFIWEEYLNILGFSLKDKSLQSFDLQAFVGFVTIFGDPAGIQTLAKKPPLQ